MTEITQLATQLGKTLLDRKLMLVTAESCTGGGIAQAITEISGSSQWFDCGLVTYSNASKMHLLHVPETLIGQHGTVSSEVVTAMAKGALATTGGNIAIATTGVAGPDGATSTKPVGTVWFGLAYTDRVYAQHHHFDGNRHAVRTQSVKHALDMLLQFLRA